MGSSRGFGKLRMQLAAHSMATGLRGRFGLEQGKVEGPACRMGSLPHTDSDRGFCVPSH